MKKKILIAVGTLVALSLAGAIHMRKLITYEAIEAQSHFDQNVFESTLRIPVENTLYIMVLTDKLNGKMPDAARLYLEGELERAQKRLEYSLVKTHEMLQEEDAMKKANRIVKRAPDSNEMLILARVMEINSLPWENADKQFYSDMNLNKREADYKFYEYEIDKVINMVRVGAYKDTLIKSFEVPEVNHVDHDPGVVYLTFDDGVGNRSDELAQSLNELDVNATFYIVGNTIDELASDSAKDNQVVLNTMLELGHDLGSHTYSHPQLDKLDGTDLNNEVIAPKNLIEKATGYKPSSFRATYGRRSNKLLRVVSQNYAGNVNWNIDSQDWRENFSKELIKERVVRLTHLNNGGIILMHDVHDKTVEVAPIIAEILLDCGFEFKTVSQMEMDL